MRQIKYYFIITTALSSLRSCQTTSDLESSGKKKSLKNLKYASRQSLVISFPSEDKSLVIIVKDYEKAETKALFSFPFSLDSFTLFYKFCPGVSERTRFCLQLNEVSY